MALASVVSCCPNPKRPAADQPAASASVPAPVASAEPAAPAPFENPGGMWMPEQLAQQADTLRSLGLTIPAASLSDPTAHPMGAVVWLGGCSASFVSPEGLIITNHHCAGSALQFNSTPEQNLMKNGFLARSRSEEKSNGPAARVYVTQSFVDVTAQMRAGIADEPDDNKRYQLLEDRSKAKVAACEAGRPHLRCNVVSYFGGERYLLTEQLRLRDVRLVYAPAAGIGNYGGEIDNWRWPRHSGDYTFFRAYVGPDGKPASYSEANVPYRPKHHLKVAQRPLSAGDLVLVAGYPWSTKRLSTAREVSEGVDWYYPRRLKLCDDFIALLERLGKQDPELAIKGRRLLRGLSNVRTNTQGMLDGLKKGGLKDRKVQIEAELLRWIGEHPEHAAAAQAITNLSSHYDKYRGERDREAATHEALYLSTLLDAADTIVHMAEERPKPDAERHPDFQQRNHQRIEQQQQQKQRSYARRLDRAKLGLSLQRAASLPAGKQPQLLRLILGNTAPSPEAIDKALGPLYDKTKLEDVNERLRLLREASIADLKASSDPFIKLALKLRPLLQAIEDRRDAYQGALVIDRPKFIAALRASRGGVLASDANASLRVTYGTVRGYRPTPTADVYEPFTKLSGMARKHTGSDPFIAPAKLLEGASKGPYGRYVHEPLGEVPVNFLSDLDITGGNSGSPTLNAHGELVGLAFDGNYESMASDWLFIPEVTRTIHVDIRYALWIMDRVDGADHLLQEMGLPADL